jgi:starch-binding outer membrane protein, SusD/RagB family
MKSKVKIIAVFTTCVFTAGLFFSCKKDFLNEVPKDSLTLASITSGADAEALVTGCYSYMTNSNIWFYNWEFMMAGDFRSDNLYAGGNGGASIVAIDEFNSQATDFQPITTGWLELYLHINATNNVLDNVPGIKDPGFSDTRKSQILGEAKFLRALHYFNLVKNYGGVVLTLNTAAFDKEDPKKKRNTAEEVYTQIVKDLQEAEAALPVSYTNAAWSHSRATQGAAQALLAKVYAQIGKYAECLTYCNKVLPAQYGGTGTAGYTLLANYDWLFDGQHKNSIESIFELQHTINTITHGYAEGLMLPPSKGDGGYWTKFATPTHDIVKAFKAENDMVRYRAGIFWEYTGLPGQVINPTHYNPTDTIPYVWKIGRDFPGWWTGGSNNNRVLIRLADIILLKAEALNKAGQTALAVPLVNAVRARVNLSPITVSAQSDVALAVLKERRLELAFEGERWFDLLRFGTQYTIDLMKSQKDGSGANLNYNITQNKFLYPIPQTDRDNNPNLSQNPGY